MLQSIKKLDGYRILATAGEGEVGTVEEAYFDDEQWVIRYLVVDPGGWDDQARPRPAPPKNIPPRCGTLSTRPRD